MVRQSLVSSFILGASALALAGCPTRNDGTDTGMTGTDVPAIDAPVECTAGPENTAAACGDGCSNDDDDFVDCADFDCDDFCEDGGVPRDTPAAMTCDGGTMPEDSVAACSDSCDNDGNGFADCNDFDCCGVRTDCPAGTECGPDPALTIAQIQNRADPMHPTDGDRVTVTQAGMIALTGRVLVGSASGGSSRSCRFAVWVGAPVSGDFTAIQVQELIDLPVGTDSCFDLPEGKISEDFAPGDAVTSINDATYDEFCAGPMPAPSPCTDYEQSNIFLGGTATIVRGAPGTPPTGTVVAVSDLVGAAGAPGARSVALDGGLFTIEDVRIGSRVDGSFMTYFAFLPAAPTVELDLIVSNFPNTTCVRTAFTTNVTAMTTVPSVTGVLLPNFGRWSLRLRGEGDVEGLTCP
jgi:hypothetical protein